MKRIKSTSVLSYIRPVKPLINSVAAIASSVKSSSSDAKTIFDNIKSNIKNQESGRIINDDPKNTFKIMLKNSGVAQFKKHYNAKRIMSIVCLLAMTVFFSAMIITDSLMLSIQIVAMLLLLASIYILNVYQLWQYRSRAIYKFTDYLSALLDNPANILPLKFKIIGDKKGVE